MFAPRHDFFRTLAKARKATRGGNFTDADHWTRLAERHLAMAERMERLIAKEKAASKPPEVRTGPVLLDPKGCSPGGTPNWYLNMKRQERARDGQINPPAPVRTPKPETEIPERGPGIS